MNSAILALSRLTLAIMIFGTTLNAQAQQYRFTAAVDQDYTNPANWDGDYPGLQVPAGATVRLQAAAVLPADSLIIAGQLVIERGVTLQGPQVQIQVLTEGAIRNQGHLHCAHLMTAGMLMNQAGAELTCERAEVSPDGIWMNLVGGDIRISGEFVLRGRVDNFDWMRVDGDLYQYGQINVAAYATLQVSQQLLIGTEADLFYHPDANITLASR